MRERLVGSVPSAGVGTCFSRRALLSADRRDRQSAVQHRRVSPKTTTSARVSRRWACNPSSRAFRAVRDTPQGVVRLRPRTRHHGDDAFMRARVFPRYVSHALIGNARWTLGIGLQGWKQTGWSGRSRIAYLLFRDRKGIVTAFVGMIAYGLVIQFLLFAGARSARPDAGLIASPFADSPWLRALLWANAVARSCCASCSASTSSRACMAGSTACWRCHAWWSSNFINFMAVARAWKMFIVHLVTGKRLAWDKTMHDFPSADGFNNRRQRSWRACCCRGRRSIPTGSSKRSAKSCARGAAAAAC